MPVLPTDGYVPVEPVKLPCSNPAECQETDEMVADNRWQEWHYKGSPMNSSSSSSSASLIEVAGYTQEMYCAWKHALPGAWPPPPTLAQLAATPNAKPANAVVVISKP